MPAIMTHDFFGRDMLERMPESVDESTDLREAFLLGNQGPDPLFYVVASLRFSKYHKLGNTMHSIRTALLMANLKAAVNILDQADRAIGLAYAHGFICHYALDSTMHPLVFFNEYLVCDAGEDGLTRENGSEVHGVIESEFDEMVLYTKKGITIADYSPVANILHASDHVLEVIDKMYAFLSLAVYGEHLPQGVFPSAVKSFRKVQALFYSPTGQKRAVVAQIEQLARPYSFFRSMSHRPIRIEESQFDNRAHDAWTNPFTDEPRTDSFWDLYDAALDTARADIAAFDGDDFNLAAAQKMTAGLNFSGDPAPNRD